MKKKGKKIKKKVNLDEVQVESFVTALEDQETQTVEGGDVTLISINCCTTAYGPCPGTIQKTIKSVVQSATKIAPKTATKTTLISVATYTFYSAIDQSLNASDTVNHVGCKFVDSISKKSNTYCSGGDSSVICTIGTCWGDSRGWF